MEKEPLLTQVWEVCTTVANEEEAELIARSLLEARLAACIQLSGPIRSFYRWKGTVQQDAEWKLTIKTSHSNLERCLSDIRRNHRYEVPELLSYPVPRVSAEYEGWLLEQVLQPVPSISQAWHLRIASCPTHSTTGVSTNILGHPMNSIELPTGPSPLPVSFEDFADCLSRLPNVQLEPDGAFTWVSRERRSSWDRCWQLDGMIYDREKQIEYVELKGICDRATWDWLTQALSGVECVPLVVQWIASGLWFKESDFSKCIV